MALFLSAEGTLMSSRARSIPWLALLFLSPTLVGLAVFRIVPIVWAFALSFTRWQIFDKPRWVGFDNYLHILTSPSAAKVFLNTAWFAAIYVPGSIVLALVLAVLLNNGLRISAFFRGAFFLPYITATVAVALVWKWIFSTKFGILNNLLAWFGVSEPPAWLADPMWSLPAVAIVAIWKDSGFFMLMLLAGLQTIDPIIYEAARIDGAGRLRQFFEITVPLLSRSLFFVLILAVIRSTQTFELTYSLTGGGPNGASTTLAFFIYENAFVHFQMGYASALAYLLCFAVGLVTLINFYVRKRWVHE
ncbi:carbohydrate ABC transporter permease [Rhizobium rhizogenes]|uniref:carbohydrate ABC transporter permease n=1 Tax=Rhizobium rhizogenes TaxID=359 RepID=UPI0022B64CE6|nr:sugar ABC transporter permease [Rhizobium rhizogenes]MCZ7448284.1 sugar ABC transporter permease [Rhizobium rhizogenes]MCZ7465717.1 sugar ABC transporter permease [Rhizobium rhizogenes]